ncbi:tetratricopeptide repeat protein [Nonomuraea deserti]|uniref:Tetratricopeptide repeat protein n=1 Tax=Nonomuraea deserti TaxID=1848322 RepID=A0A4R4VKV0_9ACTN|nr:retropepsin-like aspartic protease [Nonomuraea deserti]TDD02944.1 tetratricopeptide repeat protein [Nonomuraea deserti]
MTLAGDFPASSRRAFLRETAMMAAAVPMVLPSMGTAAAAVKDPDQLFRKGEFDEAARGYRRLLSKDPKNAHAAAQLGYIALLSNRFAAAERFLSTATALDPGDVASHQRLAECYVRQDKFARAVPLLKRTGSPRDAAFATLYAHITGTPWQIHGARSSRVPFLQLDPLPTIEASVNGRAGRFYLDTGATLGLTQEIAEEAGLRSLATVSGIGSGQQITIHLGVLESFRIGDIEIRNLPVQWHDTQSPPGGAQPEGIIGTTLFYHFLTTMDYAGQALVLRPKSAVQERGTYRVPLWLAGDHSPCTRGSLGDYGPHIVTLDTGGIGTGIHTTVQYAKRADIKVDYDHPNEVNGVSVYPIRPDRISLGKAIRRNVPGSAAEKTFPGYPGPGQAEQFGFEIIANFSHEFFKPFAVTFDFSGMNLVITRR